MKKLSFLLLSLLLSCNSSENDNPKLNKDLLLCNFDLIEASNNPTAKPNAAIVDWRWAPGQTIKIKFLDGNMDQFEKVKRIASEWTLYANLKFEYVNPNEYADIRIGFNLTGKNNIYGAWSELGAKTAYIPQSEQTMRLGPLTGSEDDIRKTILHEFGHALGLVHETTNPNADIKWDLPKVYKYYFDLMDYSKERVDAIIINKAAVTNYSEYDPLSIMHYYVPASLTTNGVAVNATNNLSQIDKISITKWYPFPVRSIIDTGERIDIAAWRKCIKSPDGRYSLEFDSGNLYILDSTNNQKKWSVGSSAYKNAMCFFQQSGEIIISGSPSGSSFTEIIWRSKVSKVTGAQLYLQNNGDLELIQNGVVKWSSKNAKP